MSKTERESYNYIEQTCPIVDSLERKCLELIQEDLENELPCLSLLLINAVSDKVQYRVETLIGMIKEQVTERFRDTLMDLIDEKQELESEIESLNYQIDNLESRLSDANSDIEYYINQLQEK